MELQALPSRIGQVRRIVSAQLRYWRLDPLIDRAALGVTELLSNVHRHARPDKSCTVELVLLPDRLTVSVRDNDPRLPAVAEVADAADVAPMATSGRGLAMVAALSESWGARPDGDKGKVVWFTLPAPTAVRRQEARTPHRTAQRQPTPHFVDLQSPPAPVTAPAPVVVRASPPAPAPAVVPAAVPAEAASTPARSAVPG